ncbi:MAG: hypothetical protein R2699_06950 [Acidimicrobiales bacterium]
MDIEAAKALVCERVDALAPALLAVSHDIHEHPELAFEEHHAHDVLADALDAHGLATTRHAHGVATALRRGRPGGADHRRAVRVRRPARHRPCLRPQHHRRRRARRRARGGAGRRGRGRV